MEKEIVKIVRGPSMEKQTLGVMVGKNFKLYSLELPWKNNEFQVSCIPTGTYDVVPRFSTKYGNHFMLKNVPGRTYILIHIANFYKQIKGCIGVGFWLTDINKDALPDTVDSGKALKLLVDTYPKGFTLIIE